MTTRPFALTLPDDGIIDPVAVEIAVRGIRPVALTLGERRAAAARILARGGTPYLIAKRLHVSYDTARRLAVASRGPANCGPASRQAAVVAITARPCTSAAAAEAAP